MEKQLAEEIVGYLPQGQTCFNYYPERYAWILAIFAQPPKR